MNEMAELSHKEGTPLQAEEQIPLPSEIAQYTCKNPQ